MFFPLLKNKSLSRYIATLIALLVLAGTVSAQEALKSAEEDYYDFLSLQGLANRPALNYRTLSDGQWQLEGAATEGNHVWAANNLGTTFTLWQDSTPAENWFAHGLSQGVTLKIYGPDWYNSFNTAAPYGQNDGALWQGKGYNTSLTAGIRFEGYGFELTLKPQLSFSQNLSFDYIKPNYAAFGQNGNLTVYNGKASQYGYYGIASIDAPQRFGDKPFFVYDWGDSEVRWTWHSFTVGFGTQAIWLGPASMNPILHSNNAPSYPKVDIGLRRQPVVLPWLGWYIGDIEARIWTGRLTESDYFDNDDSNNHNMIHGLALAYAPSFVSGLTLFANRTCLVKWDWANMKYIWPLAENTHVGEQGAGEDQKMSFGFDWVFPQVGFEVYGEVGLDDFVPDSFPKGYIRYPLHTLAFTAGLKKTFDISKKNQVYGQLRAEVNFSEMSQDFQLQWPYNFGFHHQVTQGYTNRGQWLGTGYGYGGNMQYIDFTVYYSKGKSTLVMARWNPDNNFIYSQAVDKTAKDDELNDTYFTSWKANFIVGLNTLYYITKDLSVSGGFVYNMIINNHYQNTSEVMHNVQISLGAKYSL
ncbi:MAG: capsule assembly Wzi family protein [Treponema sp.]|nr:capsule assembly Wzi family protein [Treponema sp.]